MSIALFQGKVRKTEKCASWKNFQTLLLQAVYNNYEHFNQAKKVEATGCCWVFFPSGEKKNPQILLQNSNSRLGCLCIYKLRIFIQSEILIALLFPVFKCILVHSNSNSIKNKLYPLADFIGHTWKIIWLL